MNEHNPQISHGEAAADAVPVKNRRRLVKGAMLAVPAIMTLRNGAAWAGASHRCAIGTKEVAVPVIDPKTGLQAVDPNSGQPLTTTQTQVIYSTPCLHSLGYGDNDTP